MPVTRSTNPTAVDTLLAEARATVDTTAGALRDLRERIRTMVAAGATESTETDVSAAERAHRAGDLPRLEAAIRSLESTKVILEHGGTDHGPVKRSGPGEADGAATATRQARLLEAQEAERARLAQEIHDGPAQALSNAIFQVELVERALDKDPGMARVELQALREFMRRELNDVRSYISQLRPKVIAELGLNGAIRDAAEHVTGMAKLPIVADLEADPSHLEEADQTVVLRVVQEALQNVRKHALASAAFVATREDAGAWILEVRDDGRGFDPDKAAARGRRSFGLQFMRERADLIGATFEVRSQPDGGTVIRLAIPLGAEETR